MGIGNAVVNASFMRKNRWMFYLLGSPMDRSVIGGTGNENEWSHGKPCSASRPKVQFDSNEIISILETIKYPGRAKWEPMKVEFFNLSKDTLIYDWMREIQDPETGYRGEITAYSRTAVIEMLDGLGNPMEKWVMYNVWPSDISWGDLSYSKAEIAKVSITLVYSRAVMVK